MNSSGGDFKNADRKYMYRHYQFLMMLVIMTEREVDWSVSRMASGVTDMYLQTTFMMVREVFAALNRIQQY